MQREVERLVDLYKSGEYRQVEEECVVLMEAVPDAIDLGLLYSYALYEQEKFKEAVRSFKDVVSLAPDLVNAYVGLGHSLSKTGCFGDSANAYEAAIELDPGNAENYGFLGAVLSKNNEAGNAISCYAKALELNPTDADLFCDLGNVLVDVGEFNEAVNCYKSAISIVPDHAMSYYYCAKALQEIGETKEAIQFCSKSILYKNDCAEVYHFRGILYQIDDNFEEAIVSYTMAVDIAPDFFEAHSSLGVALMETGEFSKAVDEFVCAIDINPDYAEAHKNLAHVKLLLGDFVVGWREYEWRKKMKGSPRVIGEIRQPEWSGECLDGKSILLYDEQGNGDTIQFVRYVKLLSEKYDVKIVVACKKEMYNILHSISEIDYLVSEGEEIPCFDCYSLFMSLPFLLNTDISTVPGFVPYIYSERKSFIGGVCKDRFNIGIVWAGNPKHTNDKNRSIPIELLEPLARMEQSKLFSMQMGEKKHDLRGCSFGDEVEDITGEIFDYVDTVSLIDELDLVISVDTSVAHLAGAMGKPTWVLLPYVPDFRWLLHRDDSPWYPTVLLFRQKEKGDWKGVIEQVSQKLTSQFL